MIELVGFIGAGGLLFAVILHNFTGSVWEDQCPVALCEDNNYELAAIMNVPGVPPFYTIRRADPSKGDDK